MNDIKALIQVVLYFLFWLLVVALVSAWLTSCTSIDEKACHTACTEGLRYTTSEAFRMPTEDTVLCRCTRGKNVEETWQNNGKDVEEIWLNDGVILNGQ